MTSCEAHHDYFQFPTGFLWGAATASHQVEGNNRTNDWWQFEQAGKLPFRSGMACNHFEKYVADFDLISALGHNAHRLSIEWSRIEPQENSFDFAALEHYARVIKALRARHIEPVVTLHHFTNPNWFARKGGWERKENVHFFCRYVRFVVQRLSPDVRFWLTINEPTVYIIRGYIVGNWPPQKRGSWYVATKVLRNMCAAHIGAYQEIHNLSSQAQVGLAHSAPYITAHNAARRTDRCAASLRDYLFNDLLFDQLGPKPRECLDFIGINYYVRQLVQWRAQGLGWLVGKEYKLTETNSSSQRYFSSLGWEMYPNGLRCVLDKFAKWQVPLLITENGIATEDEKLRSDFIEQHVQSLALAMKQGADVRGYFYWTLFDNFEWSEGWNAKFGLAATDTETFCHRLRPAADLYKKICESGRVDLMTNEQV